MDPDPDLLLGNEDRYNKMKYILQVIVHESQLFSVVPFLGNTQYILWLTNSDMDFFPSSEEGKKIKNENWSQFFFLVGNISDVLNRNSTEKEKIFFWLIGGKNKKSQNVEFFFLVGHNFIA